jgi:hypothetical protein
MSSGVDPSSWTQNLLEKHDKTLFKGYVVFICKDFWTKYKIKEKQNKKKPLRKELKLSDKKASV